eukprot:TRINITY_DN1137_c0_g4_i1.p2 TRINITY_DN1137_c0_g4~~TRINITY_DN1137_c0_g4_i1.p2  ORF type:complete len:386 (+),score=142.09 TRINITY_DN1137_c0_g4_i1:98-1159(+)
MALRGRAPPPPLARRRRRPAAAAAAAAALLLAAAPAARAGAALEPDPFMFPRQFSVVTGTTIPHNNGLDSVTQHGVVYYDAVQQRVRMDHAWQQYRSTFIANFEEGKLYSFTPGRCMVMLFNGTLEPFAIPKGALLHEDSTLVRDTVVSHYEGVIRTADGKLQRIDFFAKKLNRSSDEPGNWIPWRTTYSRSLRKELAPPDAEDNRDWRIYGEQPRDQLAPLGIQQRGLVPFQQDVKIYTDYFNFHAGPPDDAVFKPPAACHEPGPSDTFDFSYFAQGHTQGFGQQVFEFQKTLTDQSVASPEYQQHLDDRCSVKTKPSDAHPMPRAILEEEVLEQMRRESEKGTRRAEEEGE